MPDRRRSLRLRLTLLTAGLLALALAAGAVALTTVLSQTRLSALDTIVRERAGTVADLAAADRVPTTLPVAEPGEIVQVLDAEGRVVATSPTASRTLPVVPAGELAALRAEAAASAEGTAVRTTEVSAYDRQARVGARAVDDRTTVVATMPLREVQTLRAALQVAVVVVVPLLTALLGLTVWLVLGRALRPVEQMRAAAAGIARSGQPGALPERTRDDELGALSRTLNEMLDRLGAASARQRRFVADAAHELRSPLASMRVTVEVARTHPEAYDTAELAAEVGAEVLRLQALVDDLLLLARVGATPPERHEVDLVQVVGAAVAASAGAVPGAVPVRVEGGGRAVGDPTRIGRVVRNLVDNAVRHARSEVRVTVTDGRVVVDDDGHGIAAEDRERVFERFVRLEEAREREAGGSGLGLAIAREVARDQGGDVELGDAPSRGLRATVRLPLA